MHRLRKLVKTMEPGTAVTLPLGFDPLPEGGVGTRMVTVCRSKPGAKQRIPERVYVETPVCGLKVSGTPLVVRTLNMGQEYWIEFVNPFGEVMEGLCGQEQGFYFIYDRGDADAVRKIITTNTVITARDTWRQVRDAFCTGEAPTDDAFVEAAAQFLADHRDLAEIHRQFKAGNPEY